MIGAIALLLVCQLAGEVIHRLTGLPLPGSVIGMVLLLAWLAFVPRERLTLTQVTGWLTAHLSIMFVPAAVGLMEEGAILSRYGLSIVVAVVVSGITNSKLSWSPATPYTSAWLPEPTNGVTPMSPAATLSTVPGLQHPVALTALTSTPWDCNWVVIWTPRVRDSKSRVTAPAWVAASAVAATANIRRFM